MPEDFFDFRQVSEEKDSLNYHKLKECPHCKKPIAEDATICYYCGRDVKPGPKPGWFRLAALVLVMLLVAYLIIWL